jgi:hypothetical protein
MTTVFVYGTPGLHQSPPAGVAVPWQRHHQAAARAARCGFRSVWLLATMTKSPACLVKHEVDDSTLARLDRLEEEPHVPPPAR